MLVFRPPVEKPMVQPMIEAKFSEYRLVNSGTGGHTGEKQQSVSVTKVSLQGLKAEIRNKVANRLGNDKQQPVLVKEKSVRDLQSEMRNEVANPLGTSPISNGGGPVVDATKVSGIKRPEPDCPLHPNYCRQTLFGNSTNRHLVYVRRKFEPKSGTKKASENGDETESPQTRPFSSEKQKAPELGKEKACENGDKAESLQTRTFSSEEQEVPELRKERVCENGDKTESPQTRTFSSENQKVLGQKSQMQDLNISCSLMSAPAPVASVMAFSRRESSVPQLLDKPANELKVAEPQYPIATIGIHTLVNSHRNHDQHLKDRFLRLQMFLKNCDQSSQEEYIHRLRSLSAVARSRHAVELEERVVRLLLEEGQELRRTKVLNLLEKSAPMKYVSTATQPHPVAALSEK